jgi:hypothetical protein
VLAIGIYWWYSSTYASAFANRRFKVYCLTIGSKIKINGFKTKESAEQRAIAILEGLSGISVHRFADINVYNPNPNYEMVFLDHKVRVEKIATGRVVNGIWYD